ncbi:hypothetical protein [Rhodopila sp.]|uniref:hypothetical protein n=1 Tax=Rhodopila sp. TaxID=2480087 RepID=UPI003D0FC973
MGPIIAAVIGFFGSIISGIMGKNKSRDDDVQLGKDENELQHVKQENADRASMEAVPPATAADTADSLRTGRF